MSLADIFLICYGASGALLMVKVEKMDLTQAKTKYFVFAALGFLLGYLFTK